MEPHVDRRTGIMVKRKREKGSKPQGARIAHGVCRNADCDREYMSEVVPDIATFKRSRFKCPECGSRLKDILIRPPIEIRSQVTSNEPDAWDWDGWWHVAPQYCEGDPVSANARGFYVKPSEDGIGMTVAMGPPWRLPRFPKAEPTGEPLPEHTPDKATDAPSDPL